MIETNVRGFESHRCQTVLRCCKYLEIATAYAYCYLSDDTLTFEAFLAFFENSLNFREWRQNSGHRLKFLIFYTVQLQWNLHSLKVQRNSEINIKKSKILITPLLIKELLEGSKYSNINCFLTHTYGRFTHNNTFFKLCSSYLL